MIYCKICGHESHCGISLYKDYRDVWDNRRGQIKVCYMCSCEECENKEMTIKEYIEQHKKHEAESASTNARNRFWKNRKLKND